MQVVDALSFALTTTHNDSVPIAGLLRMDAVPAARAANYGSI
jgi:hypothetical protein